jgi:hypothetical protein
MECGISVQFVKGNSLSLLRCHPNCTHEFTDDCNTSHFMTHFNGLMYTVTSECGIAVKKDVTLISSEVHRQTST